MIYIRDDTRVHRLLMMLTCVGEYPTSSLSLLGNARVWRRLIRKLNRIQGFCIQPDGQHRRFRLLTLSGRNRNQTIRLHQSAIPILKEFYPEAWAYYMEFYDCHHFSGHPSHVDRNHRVAETVAMFAGAMIEANQWILPDLHEEAVRSNTLGYPVYYLSRLLKDYFPGELNKTSFSRITGALVSPGGIYAVYNTRDRIMKWNGSGEGKARLYLTDIFRTALDVPILDRAILFGQDYEVALRSLDASTVKGRRQIRFCREYLHTHFIPLNRMGQKMLAIQDEVYRAIRVYRGGLRITPNSG